MATLVHLGSFTTNWDWQHRAACRGMDVEVFYDEDSTRGRAKRDHITHAKAICATCPVLGVPVVKVFNGIFWKHLLERGVPAGTPGRIALPVAGDDGPAKQAVFDLVDQLGFDSVDGGSLEESWRQQPGTPVYGKDFDTALTLEALADAPAERPADFRA